MLDSVLRFTAFSRDPAGGNPAGVWVGDALPSPEEMQRIAADVGFSETAFAAGRGDRRVVRYYSPVAEVPFCGHATIALAIALSGGEPSEFVFDTLAGSIPVRTEMAGGSLRATLRSAEPQTRRLDEQTLYGALDALGWGPGDLDAAFPPALAYGGAWHLVIAAGSRERLADLSYDFDALLALMAANDILTVQLIWKEGPNVIHARNPFPTGGVVEDPATGAAAAALGGLLRERGIQTPSALVIRQGEDMGQPSTIYVGIPPEGGIDVSGFAVELP